jgi:hypothetical protein
MADLIGTSVNRNKRWAIGWLMAACLLFATLIGFQIVPVHAADSSEVVERTVKAAYLYKFGNFIEWPEQAFSNQNSAFTIGVIGADSFADELEQIVSGRAVNGRPVTVQRLWIDDPLAGVNVLFIGHSQNSRLGEILAAAKGQPVLTVTESEKGIALGSMINFVVIDGRLRFEVAPKAAGMGKLVISARLLAAAYKVAMGTS